MVIYSSPIIVVVLFALSTGHHVLFVLFSPAIYTVLGSGSLSVSNRNGQINIKQLKSVHLSIQFEFKKNCCCDYEKKDSIPIVPYSFTFYEMYRYLFLYTEKAEDE